MGLINSYQEKQRELSRKSGGLNPSFDGLSKPQKMNLAAT
jgi:hypothetical protein